MRQGSEGAKGWCRVTITRTTGRIAVNVADLTRYPKLIIELLIAPHISRDDLIDGEPGRMDGGATVLKCPPTQANAIVHLLHHKDDQLGQYRTRVYDEGPRGGWKQRPNMRKKEKQNG